MSILPCWKLWLEQTLWVVCPLTAHPTDQSQSENDPPFDSNLLVMRSWSSSGNSNCDTCQTSYNDPKHPVIAPTIWLEPYCARSYNGPPVLGRLVNHPLPLLATSCSESDSAGQQMVSVSCRPAFKCPPSSKVSGGIRGGCKFSEFSVQCSLCSFWALELALISGWLVCRWGDKAWIRDRL